MTAQESNGENASTGRNVLERGPSILAVSVAVVYFLGFLVVIRHLSAYGVSSFALLKPQYLAAGFWALVPVGIGLLTHCVGTSRAWLAEAATTTVARFLRSLLVDIVGWLLLLGIPLLAALMGLPTEDFYSFVRDESIPLLVTVIIVSTIPHLITWYRESLLAVKKGAIKDIEHAAKVNLLVAVGSLLCIAYIFYFGGRIYPRIPYAWGGGRPLSVVFLLSKQSQPSPVMADPTGNRSVPYRLLLVTDTHYVVVSPSDKEKSIEFARNEVMGMIVLGE